MKKLKYAEHLPVSVLALSNEIQVKKWLKENKYQKMVALKIPVVSIGDIIKMKKRAKRDKDMLDLKVLKYLSTL